MQFHRWQRFFRQSKQKFRRQRINLSRIFVTNVGKQLEPVWGSDFIEAPIILISKGAPMTKKLRHRGSLHY